MKIKASFFYPFILGFILFGCAPTNMIFQTSNFVEYQKKHKTVAILPFGITIDIKSLPQGMKVADFKSLQRDEALYIQDFFYASLLKENQRTVFSTTFQDVRITNDRLAKNNISFENISDIDKSTLAQTCKADAIITGIIYRSNPISPSGKIKNRVDMKVSVHDGNGKLLWEYYNTNISSTSISSLYLVKDIIGDIIKRLPYCKAIKGYVPSVPTVVPKKEEAPVKTPTPAEAPVISPAPTPQADTVKTAIPTPAPSVQEIVSDTTSTQAPMVKEETIQSAPAPTTNDESTKPPENISPTTEEKKE